MAWTDSRTVGRGVALRTSYGDERITAELVSTAYFSVLHSPMSLGTGFQPAGHAALEVVIGHGFWNRRLGGATDVIGRRLTLNGYPFIIVDQLPDSTAD